MPQVDDALRPDSFVSLLDFRRRVAESYAEIRRRGSSDAKAHRHFRESREELFARHPQSPLDLQQRRTFSRLAYYPYDPRLRYELPLDPDVAPEILEVELSGDGPIALQRTARIHFQLEGRLSSLSLFWIRGYGGGLFLPFRDSTNGQETYGGGRYLIDTIKGADLGGQVGKIVVDFNYAYNPSCAYNPSWDCPLAPAENWLEVPVRAGEQAFSTP